MKIQKLRPNNHNTVKKYYLKIKILIQIFKKTKIIYKYKN